MAHDETDNGAHNYLRGEPVSLWLATGGETTHYPQLHADIDVDVAIVGGGIVGLTTAWALQQSGRRVALIEAGRVATGVTGHTTGKVTSLHRLVYRELRHSFGEDGARRYGEANQAAIEYIAQLVVDEGIDCDFRRVPNYTFAESYEALDLVRQEVAIARRLGLPASYVTETPLPFPVKGAVRFDDQARVHAVKYLRGLATAVAARGGLVFEQTEVTRVADGTPGVVTTEGGTVRATEVVMATNTPLNDHGLFAVRCHPYRSHLVAGRVNGVPLNGMFISADNPLRSILPTRIGGDTYMLVGGEEHRLSEPGQTGERYQRLASYAAERLGLGTIAYHWSTQDAMPVDGLPYVGRLAPWSKHVYVVAGLGTWGLSNGTAAALIVADAIIGRTNPWAKLFNSNRLTPMASGGRFFRENIHAATTLVRSRLHRPVRRDLPGPMTKHLT